MSRGAEVPVVVGRVTRCFGVRGWVWIASFTRPPGNLVDYRPWLIAAGDGWQEAEPESIRARGKGWVARFPGCVDRDGAEAWVGRDLAVPRTRLPAPEDEAYYWSDLLGLAVRTIDGIDLGRVDRIQETGANDVLVVRGEDRERLIPFVARWVPEVDLAAGEIRVDWDPDF